jgi:hypothetical protein
LWILVSFALVIGWALSVPAQSGSQAKGGSSKPAAKEGEKPAAKDKGADASGKGDEQEKQGVADVSKTEKTDLEERFVDPRITDEVMDKKYPQLFTNVKELTKDEKKRIEAMAAGGQVDRDFVARFARSEASQLTNPRFVQAMRDDAGKPEDVQKIEEAAQELIKAYDLSVNNNAFRDVLTTSLVDKAVGPELLRNNIFSRNQYMIVISHARDPKAIPIIVAQLNDRDQILSVKLNAAVALIHIAQTSDVSPQDAIRAAKALSDFLDNESDIFWPVQMRALEALGWLRQATERPTAASAEFSETALKILADSKGNVYARAWAAWALGMIQPPTSFREYNLLLIASHAGYLAAETADRIVDVEPKNSEEARKLTNSLLVILQAFRSGGQDAPRNGGLLAMNNQAAAQQQGGVLEIEKRVRALVAHAIELDFAVARFKKDRRVALANQVQELVSYLDAHKPNEPSLVPGGQPFPLPAFQPKGIVEPPAPAKKAVDKKAKAAAPKAR